MTIRDIQLENDSLRTGDCRIIEAGSRWAVRNLRTGTTTVAMSLSAARRVLLAAQR